MSDDNFYRLGANDTDHSEPSNEKKDDKSRINKMYLGGFVMTILMGFMQFGWQQGNWNVIQLPYQ